MRLLSISVLVFTLSLSALGQNDLPSKFSKLPGTWEFSKLTLISSGEDMTQKYLDGQNNGKTWQMEFKANGDLESSKKQPNVGSAKWDYLTEDEREKSPYINLTITTYDAFEGREMGTEYFTLVSVDDDKLVYKNEALDMKWEYVRK